MKPWCVPDPSELTSNDNKVVILIPQNSRTETSP